MSAPPEHLSFASSLTVADLVGQFDVELVVGPSDMVLTHVSSAHTVTAGSFIALYDDRLIEHLPAAHRFACLTTSARAEQLTSSCPQAAILVCDNPRQLYADMLTSLFKPKAQTALSGGDTVSVDASASVHPEAVLGPYVFVGPHCVVDAGAVIGAHAVLAGDVHVGAECHVSEQCWLGHSILGARTRLAQNTVIGKRGFGFEGQGAEARFIPHLGRVITGEGCDIGAGVTIDRGVLDDTLIGAHVMIDNQVHIAHNVTIGDNCIILAQAGIAGSARIGANCIIGGQVGIADHVSLCEGVTVASKSGITKDIDMPGTYAGFPAEPARKFWTQQAALRRLAKAKAEK